MIFSNQRILFFFFAICFFQFTATLEVHAQARLVEGEKVRVLVVGSWRDGTVIESKGKKALVSYVFVSETQKVIDRVNIRKLCETVGIDYARSWSTADGNYQVIASLKDVTGEKAVLVKEDLTEVSVPLASLSTKDRAYAKKTIKNRNAAVEAGKTPAMTPTLPPIQDFEAGGTFGQSVFDSSQAVIRPFGALPPYLKFSQNGMGFNFLRELQELVSVIPVGGPQELVLVGAREDSVFSRNENFQSQLYWISMKESKVLSKIAITSKDFPLDYNPVTKTLLTLHKKKTFDKSGIPSHYTLWRLLPGKTEATPLIRWSVEIGTFTDGKFAKIVNEQVILAKTKKHTYVAWDLKERKEIYTIKPQSFFDVPAILTHDRRSLIVCEDRQLTVFDAATGEIKNQFLLKERGLSGANVNATGTKLAGINARQVFVWDLESGSSEPKVYNAPHVGSPFTSRIEWVDDDLILCESSFSRVLYKLSVELPVWSYRMDVSDSFLNKDPLKSFTIGGKLVYVAKPGRLRDKSLHAVGIVNLPGPQVKEITENVDRNSLNILGPGVRVGVTIESVTDPARVEEWLTKKIEANGWIYDENAEIQMVANMGIGANQTIQYQQIGGNQQFTVSFQPHFSNLKIKKGNSVLWQNGTSTGAPSFIRAENPQAEIDRYQNPNLEFFNRVSPPERIIDPKYSRGFGVSKFGLRGIEVESTTPPGREDDPEEAAKKAQEEAQKRLEEERNGKKEGDQDGNN